MAAELGVDESADLESMAAELEGEPEPEAEAADLEAIALELDDAAAEEEPKREDEPKNEDEAKPAAEEQKKVPATAALLCLVRR